ncbi:homocysteine S-methyltransferase family protein, partial [Ellagibacter isourolithinifaciens]|uniref:homocysteine S-methyltransferase family protein n=1 Tax=Ellagibacter isourolithinifaciens TaxID=2137581 RepID=UPI003A8FFFF4
MGDSVCTHKELTGGWAKAAQLPRPDLSGLAIKDEHLKRALLGQDFLVVDGAMGTQLQERGLADAGQIPELLNFSHPDDIAAIHKAYVDAGAEVITTNTFGANRLKLEGAASVEDVYRAAAECARAAGAPYIAGDVGPTGALLEPMGTMSFEEAYDLFAEQVRAVAAAGCDVVLIETMADLREAKAALLAAQENCDLPVFATMTFGEDGRTFLGTSPEVAA